MADVKKAILMNKRDSVAVALSPIQKDESAEITFNNEIIDKVLVLEDIEIYHKIAIKPICKGEKVYKYGEVIGRATDSIKIGQHVHVNNIESVMMTNED